MPEDKSKLEKKAEEPKNEAPRIDPDVPWYEEHNLGAAKKLGVRYSRARKCYVDSDGCPVLDSFGQPLG